MLRLMSITPPARSPYSIPKSIHSFAGGGLPAEWWGMGLGGSGLRIPSVSSFDNIASGRNYSKKISKKNKKKQKKKKKNQKPKKQKKKKKEKTKRPWWSGNFYEE